MKFFRNRPLNIQIAFLLTFLAVIIVVEFSIIRWRIVALEQHHHQRDVARKSELLSQQIMLETNLLLQGSTDLGAQILADAEQHDYMLKVLTDGGRVDGTSIFIDKLDRLSAISLQEVSDHWIDFKQKVSQAISSDNSGVDRKMLEVSWISISSWYDKLITDLDVVVRQTRSSLNIWMTAIVFVNIGLIASLYYLFRKKVIDPLKLIERNTKDQIQTHDLPPNEIADVAASVNEVTEHLKDASQFIQEIGKGNLSIDYKELDARYAPGKNKLADSLIEMQRKLRDMNDEEQRRQWANDGLTKFVDILRTGGENINQLGDEIIAALVGYTRSNQGGLYLLNDDDPNNKFLELISLFAFDTRKFESQRIKPGEGILGQTFLEKETTYLKEMPHEYIRITSGLGGANPKSLLLVPLKIDQVVYGVIELASFNEYKEHEIKFVERLSETISSTFASVKSAQRNRALLEESHTVTEMMRAQEEEMRQNMEELQATQEEMGRKERDYIAKIDQLEKRLKVSSTSDELDRTKAELVQVQGEMDRMKKELAEERTKGDRGGDWAIVEDIEKVLRINLEALKITREELDRGMD
ncbi:MAG TPA: GAF domain-containing protein [Cyclobacteriaceae bacterium]|nr:GAF domain-containing protein [Cyclobacteriaceae bacterium]